MLAFPNGFKVKGTRIEDSEASIWIPGLGPGPGWGGDSKQACYTFQNVSSNSIEQIGLLTLKLMLKPCI